MKDFKLEFQEIDQSYSHMDLQKTLKGNVKQSVGNLVTVLLNPKYSKAKKLYEGQIFYDIFTNEIKIQGKIMGEKGIRANQIRLWDDSLNNRLGLEIEKHFDLNYNANKMWEAIRFVANQYEVSPPKQYLERLKWGGDEGAIRKLLPTYLGAGQFSTGAKDLSSASQDLSQGLGQLGQGSKDLGQGIDQLDQ